MPTEVDYSTRIRRSHPSTKKKKLALARIRGPYCERCGCKLRFKKRRVEGESTRRAKLHHIIPRRYGGTNAMDNLLLTCMACEVSFHRNENLKVQFFFQGS